MPVPAHLALHLNPTRAIGDGSQFQVMLVNEGTTPLTVVLRGSDDADALTLLFQVPRVAKARGLPASRERSFDCLDDALEVEQPRQVSAGE